MINKNIYDGALTLLGEDIASENNEDLEERAPYLIAAFCSECSDIDAKLRESEGRPEQKNFNPVWISLDSPFPLSDAFSSPACLYVAAMLVIDERPELSDKLYDMYCDKISTLMRNIPAILEPIADKYF